MSKTLYKGTPLLFWVFNVLKPQNNNNNKATSYSLELIIQKNENVMRNDNVAYHLCHIKMNIRGHLLGLLIVAKLFLSLAKDKKREKKDFEKSF